jgi:DNA-binding response OmpR family regulator
MIRVLSFGYVDELLQKRHRFLAASGFEVTSIDTKSAGLRLLGTCEFDVLVIGHGVPLRDRNAVAARAKCGDAIRVIFLYRSNIRNAELADAVLSVDSSAEDLPQIILRLVGEQSRIVGCG